MSAPANQRFCVVLVRTQGPVNLGMICRICANTGLTDLRLVDPQCPTNCADSRKFANHERHRLIEGLPTYTTLTDATADCGLVIGTTARLRDPDHGEPIPLRGLGEMLARRPAKRTALVFGNEADGLSIDELRACQEFITLETPGHYHSYNLANAVAIVTYHAATLAQEPAPARQPAAAAREHVERLAGYWLDSLERINYFRRTPRDRWEPTFRDMLNRWPLTRHDVDVLFGIFAQVNYHAFGNKHADDL